MRVGFLDKQLVLAHVWGIPVRVGYAWFIVLAILATITASSIDSRVENFGLSLVLGVAATLFFFGSIFVHELAHAWAARLEKLQVVEIVLHPFGGLTRFRHEPETPRAEFRIAVAGPAASFLLTVIFVALMAAANAAELDILAVIIFLLAVSNFLLAIFNMFPGYPLDGGRVLRAYLWRSGRDLNEATVLTGRAGQIIGAGLVILGLLIVLVRGELFTGFWTAVVGLFLFNSARGIIREVNDQASVVVADVMALPVSVEPETTVLHLVDHVLPVHRRTVFPVAKNKKMHGMLVLEDVKTLDRDAWRTTTVAKVMRTVDRDHFVETRAAFAEAKELMETNGIGAVAVVDSHGNLVGFLQEGRLKRRR